MSWVLYIGPESSLATQMITALAEASVSTQTILKPSPRIFESTVERMGVGPVIVVIDQRVQSDDDLSLGRAIKIQDINPAPYVITLLADNASGQERLHAYDCGADMILCDPIDADEFLNSVQQILAQRRYVSDLENQLGGARRAAFNAMSTSSRIGQIVRFMQQTLDSRNSESIAECFYEVMRSLELRGTLFLNSVDGPKYYSAASLVADDEVRQLASADVSRRLIQTDTALIVRDKHCALIVNAFDQQDETAREQLRDDLCILIEAIESRACGLLLEKEVDRRRSLVDISLRVLGRILEETDIFNREFTDQSANVIHALMDDMRGEFSYLDLKESEEARLVGMLESCSEGLHNLFERKRERDAVLKEILEKLLSTLAK